MPDGSRDGGWTGKMSVDSLTVMADRDYVSHELDARRASNGSQSPRARKGCCRC